MSWGANITNEVLGHTDRELASARATIRELEKRSGGLEAERDALKLQAVAQAQEMRAHKSSLHEAYQYITGATGEPGNWNGAQPIKEAVDKLCQALTAERQRREALQAAIRKRRHQFAHWRGPRMTLSPSESEKVKPVRLRLSRKKGFSLQALSLETNGLPAISCARPGVLGNPFPIGKPSGYLFEDGGDPTPLISCMTREQSVEMFDDIFTVISPEMHPWGHKWMERFRKFYNGMTPGEVARHYLRGHNLACHCGPDEACHVDIWLREANPKVWFRVGEDHSYYGGPDYKCVTAEQCSELEKRFAEAEHDIADNPPKVTG